MRRRLSRPLSADALSDGYQRLARWTGFWLDHRRVPGHQLPYYQHGNDSGWDNATTFDGDRVIETPDLAALLILQLRQLADLAAELGRPAAATRWSRIADGHPRRTAGEALGRASGSPPAARATARRGRAAACSTSCPSSSAPTCPPTSAPRSPAGSKRHLTAHGLATEPVDSPHYAADGYWRGPIWAPATILIEDGLRRAGHTGLADEVSQRFRALCEKSGFAENFDAETGAGLRDRAYTWTASSYLLLAAAHERRRHP